MVRVINSLLCITLKKKHMQNSVIHSIFLAIFYLARRCGVHGQLSIWTAGVPGTWRGSDGCHGSPVDSLRLSCLLVEPDWFSTLPEYQHVWRAGLEALHHGQEGVLEERVRERERGSEWERETKRLSLSCRLIPVFLVPSFRRIWSYPTSVEGQRGIPTQSLWWTSLWFTSGAKNGNSLWHCRLYAPTAPETGRPSKSIGIPTSLWQITDKVMICLRTNYLSDGRLSTTTLLLSPPFNLQVITITL